MEVKKSPKADLERGKSMSILMGMIVGLAVLFVGFEWSNRDIEIATDQGVSDIIAEEDIEITRPEEQTPPPELPAPPPVAEVLTVVEDDVELDDVDIASSEDDARAAQVDTYVPPAAVEEEEESADHIFQIVEKMPEFPGGAAALTKYLNKNTNYPIIAQENGIHGRVTVGFVVNTDGSIVDIKVIRGVDPSLDKEALRVVSTMPKWTPGEQRGKPVRVSFSVPVVFRLQ